VIKTRLQQQLGRLNADTVISDRDAGNDFPRLTISVQDWLLTYTAYPVEPAHRGNRGRILALPPTPGAMWINNVGLIRKALRDKGSNYSELDKPLEDPLIVAINTWWVASTSMRTRNLTHCSDRPRSPTGRASGHPPLTRFANRTGIGAVTHRQAPAYPQSWSATTSNRMTWPRTSPEC
jgi:hypothetical protein